MTTIHIVPHTHWDREWYQPFQIFRMRLVHLMDRLLDILASEPQFIRFTLDGQAIVLEDYLAIRPQRRAELQALVRDGRLDIGPWYVLPDEFLVSPESLVRNLLRGREVCATFGPVMAVGYIPDPFGHIGQMPQILRGFQIESACVERGLGDLPCELWWQAPDGSRLLLASLREGYDNAARMPVSQPAFDDFVRLRRDALLPHCQTGQLLLLNGTDHHEAQPELPDLIRTSRLDDTVSISSLPTYLSAVAQEVAARRLSLPVVQGELRSPQRHHLLPGVLSSRMWIKQRNHTCQVLLERWAEPFTVWAELSAPRRPAASVWTGHLRSPRLERPADLLAEAWRLLLECQPHDSICGCSIDQVHQEMGPRFDQVEQIADELTRQCLEGLAAAVDTTAACPAPSRGALVVFNAGPAAQTGLARGSLELPAGLDVFEVRGHDGRPVPFRLVERRTRELADLDLDHDGLLGMTAMVEDGRALGLAVQAAALVPEGERLTIDVIVSETGEPAPEVLAAALPEVERWRQSRVEPRFRLRAHFATQAEIEVLAEDIPACGYRSYALVPASSLPGPTQADAVRQIDNGRLRAEIDSRGRLSLTDLRHGAVYPDLLRFVDVADRGDTYNFCPLDGDPPIDRPARPAVVRRLADSCGQTLEWDQVYCIPRSLADDRRRRSAELVEIPIRSRLTLTPGVDRLDLEILLNNTAQDHRLQLVVRLPAAVSEGLYGGHYEIVRRPAGMPAAGEDWAEKPTGEHPMRHFVAAGNSPGGLLVAARGLTEAAVRPEGEIAVTLLRCVGWLSRDDLSTRKGGAGPATATPLAQCPGDQRFDLSLIPFSGSELPTADAEAYQTPLRAAGAELHTGPLPAAASFVTVEPAEFLLSSVKPAQDGRGLVVRGVLLADQAGLVRFTFLQPIVRASRIRLDESSLEPLPIDGRHTVQVSARPWEVISLRIELEEGPTAERGHYPGT